jgi:hypothetical protein
MMYLVWAGGGFRAVVRVLQGEVRRIFMKIRLNALLHSYLNK